MSFASRSTHHRVRIERCPGAPLRDKNNITTTNTSPFLITPVDSVPARYNQKQSHTNSIATRYPKTGSGLLSNSSANPEMNAQPNPKAQPTITHPNSPKLTYPSPASVILR